MILGTAVLLFALYARTSAYVSTCTQLSWESKAERENFTLYNAGNHFLVLTSMKFDCYGDDKNIIDYTNKSLLIAPGKSIHLPTDAWMYKCSATLCLACLMHQCDIDAQLTPNATLVFFYNDSGLVDFSAVGYTSLSRKKKSTHQTPVVCPNDMTSVWKKIDKALLIIDIPNIKKKKTLYTVEVMCSHSYLLTNFSDNGTITSNISHTTPVRRMKEKVVIRIPVIAEREVPTHCTLRACLKNRGGNRLCKKNFSCIFTIPDDSVTLIKVTKRKNLVYERSSCSQTKWIWSALDKQMGNLNLKIRNQDWKEKTFRVSVGCNELSSMNDSVLVTIPPMIHARLVTFPLTISSPINSTNNSTECVLKVCNTAKRRCGRNTKCFIKLPVTEGELIPSDASKVEQEITECISIMWSPSGNQRGVLGIPLTNHKQENITVRVTLNCDVVGIVMGEMNTTVEVLARSEYTLEYQLKPGPLNISAVETYCTATVCDTEDCLNSENSCNIVIPIVNGFFKQKRQATNLLDYNKRTTIPMCPSNLVFLNHSYSNLSSLYVKVENTIQNAWPFNIEIRCNNIRILQDNGTFSQSARKFIPKIQPSSHEVVQFMFQPHSDNEQEDCVVDICIQLPRKCVPQIECEFAVPSNVGCNYTDWTWTPYEPRKGDFNVVLHNNLLDEIAVYNVTLKCRQLRVFNDSVVKLLTPSMAHSETFSFTVEPMSLSLADTNTKCMFTICKDGCHICKVDIPVYDKQFVIPECRQQMAVWQAQQTDRGVLKVKVQNPKEEEAEALITVNCTNLHPINKPFKTIKVPGKSLQKYRFKFSPRIDCGMVNVTSETQCMVEVCFHGECSTGKKKFCIIKILVSNGQFAIALKAKRKEDKFTTHRCQDRLKIPAHIPCHDKTWNLDYTPAQLEGEALLVITLKSSRQVDLQTNVSLRCEGVIIEDDAQKIVMLSKYERKRNVSFAIATIRSLQMERHICTLSVMHSLLIPSSQGNITNNEIEKLCPMQEKCNLAIDSRVGRIIPKCSLHEVQSLIQGTTVDKKMATVNVSIPPSVYGFYTFDAYCTKNNPFIHDSEEEKQKNLFVSETRNTKVVTVHYAPDCDNETIRKEFENYRKDHCNFLLYGYCQRGELLLENLEEIHFDDDLMYCTPSLALNRWLQMIQKYTGIQNKPVAALLTIFIAIMTLLITVVIPAISIIYFCFCRHHHKHDVKRPSLGIVISSCDEWDEANAMLKTMAAQNNSKFLIGRSDHKLPVSLLSLSSDDSDLETPIYRLSKDDLLDKHEPSIKKGPDIPEDSIHSQDTVDINASSSEEQYSKLSATLMDFSSILDGWGEEYSDDIELQKSF